MSAMNAVLRHLRRQLGPPVSDTELLSAYVERRSEEAFRSLIERHGPMVLGICRRRLGNAHAAEDAFQATFLALVRSAGSVRSPQALAAWLSRCALRICGKTQAAAARRYVAENRQPSSSPADALAGLTARELFDTLDIELNRLPERYRIPLCLVYWQGLPHATAARNLGLSAGALQGRLDRGRQRLADRLRSHGLTLPALLATPLASVAVSGELLARTAALAVPGAAIPATVLALAATAGATKVLPISAITVLLAGVGLIGLAGGFGTPQAPGGKATASPNPAQQPESARAMRVIVLDPSGKPLAGAKVHSGIWTHEKDFKANHDYVTDAAGTAPVELPKTFYILRLWASKKPFVPMCANWEQNELVSGKDIPAEYVFRLESGVAASGQIVDEEGKPITGAKVQVKLAKGLLQVRDNDRMRYNPWLAQGTDAATTDASGRWRIDNVPDHPQAELSLMVYHPNFVSDERWQQAQSVSGVTTAMLRQGTRTLTLKRGVNLRGSVKDASNRPVQDALIGYGDANTWNSSPTDADGQFRLPALAPRVLSLMVIAPGWAPQLRRINLQAGMPPEEFRLEPGKPIRLRIVDAAGKPISKANVSIMGWKGSKSIQSMHNPNHPKVPDTKIPRETDANGLWEWTSAPDDPVKLRIGSKGFAAQDLEIAGSAPERTVMLKTDHRITGRLTDALTGKPIPAFTVIPIDVFRRDWLHAERYNAVAGKDGRLIYLATRTDIPLRLRVEAMGYRTLDGPEFRVGDDTSLTQDFRLQPSAPITGLIHDAEGRPVAKAEVLLATPTEQAELHPDARNHKTTTDVAGRFTFPDPGEPMAILAHNDTGFAQAEFPAGQHDTGTMRLQPWASVRGQFRDGGKTVPGATIFFQPVRIGSVDQPKVDANMQVITGPDGRFEFAKVPPGPACVRVFLGPWKDEGFRSGPSVPLDLQPGQKAELALGDAGATVTGKVKLTGRVPADLDCTYSLNWLVRRAPGIAPPPEIAELGFDIRNGWRDTWQKTVEGQAYVNTLQKWFVKLAPDGSFRVSGVPLGEYDLAVAVYAKPNGCLVDPLARNQVRVTVTAADVARGETPIAEITAPVVPVPEVGDTPALDFQNADGKAGKLADHRGHFTVVHFWASWCGPCKQQLPAVRRLHDQFAPRGLATLGLSLDDDHTAWQTALKHLELPWKQGRLVTASEAGVSSVPAYWLIDPAGKIVAKVYDTDELAKAVADRLK